MIKRPNKGREEVWRVWSWYVLWREEN